MLLSTHIHHCRCLIVVFNESKEGDRDEEKISDEQGRPSFALLHIALQPNCALDKWRDMEGAREEAIKIKHLGERTRAQTLNTHTHADVSKAWCCLCVMIVRALRGTSVFEGALPDSNPILRNPHPLCNLCLLFFHA